MLVIPTSIRSISSKSNHMRAILQIRGRLFENSCVNLCRSIFKHRYKCTDSMKFLKPKNDQHVCLYSGVKDQGDLLDFAKSISDEEKKEILKNMQVVESFLSDNEEESILSEIEPYMRRLRYEYNHWDNAIHGFRETERAKWNEENSKILDRLRDFAFPPGTPQLHHVHVLDLAEEGHIKPHIDSVRFCGNTIAGLSLLTDAVMRLVYDKDKTKTVDVLLKRKSLYIMRDAVRYDYTHEVLPNKESTFKNVNVPKKRRISVICRNEPTSTD